MAEPSLTDAELIARVVVQDDRHAFSEIVRRHQSAVRATLRRLTAGNHALADDIAQETFMLAFRNLRSFRQESKFSTWLYRIATNAYLADARKRKEELLGNRDADIADDDGDDAPSAEAGGRPRYHSTWIGRLPYCPRADARRLSSATITTYRTRRPRRC